MENDNGVLGMNGIEQCREEQKRAAAYLLEHGDDRGARLGISDWMAEEIAIEDRMRREEGERRNV